MTLPPAPPTVAILAYPETGASVVYGMYDLFMSAGRDWGFIVGGEPGPNALRPLVVSREGKPFLACNDVPVTPHAALVECPAPDVICIPEINLPPGEDIGGIFEAEVKWLVACHSRGSILATACSGAMLLAQAGLLDGLEATTHWAWCDVMRERFPRVEVCEHRALVTSGEGQRLIMAGAGVSWLDLALYLIARLVDVETAMQTARLNLINWHEVGQQPFARLARTRQSEDALIAQCQTWIAQHYRERSPVASMVRLSGLAERSFTRRFQQATGMSPLQYVHTLRLEEAKQMLESGEEPIESIAGEVGYEDAGFFSRLFKRQVNLTPAQYRRRFGSMRRALQSGRI